MVDDMRSADFRIALGPPVLAIVAGEIRGVLPGSTHDERLTAINSD